MSVHIWCPRASDSAIALRDALRAQGIRCYKSKPNVADYVRFATRTQPGDLLVNWGAPRTASRGIKVLNSARFLNKRDQLIKLAQHGIPCPEVFDEPGNGRIGRSFRHQCGRDIINNTGRDYWTQWLTFNHEIRVHVFQGLAIHTGLKVPRISNPNPRIRSYDAGWKIDYSQADKIKKDRRELAKRAVAALGLDFGAVDIGVTPTQGPAVIEVNTAPGLEGGTIDAYVKQIMRVINESERR